MVVEIAELRQHISHFYDNFAPLHRRDKPSKARKARKAVKARITATLPLFAPPLAF